jgi:hypothetical protein
MSLEQSLFLSGYWRKQFFKNNTFCYYNFYYYESLLVLVRLLWTVHVQWICKPVPCGYKSVIKNLFLRSFVINYVYGITIMSIILSKNFLITLLLLLLLLLRLITWYIWVDKGNGIGWNIYALSKSENLT